MAPEQSSSATPAPAAYEGPDRLARIATAARREGSLNLYTTIAEKDLATLVDPFEAKYGVEVTVWRAGTDKVLQRTVAEAAAGRYEMDVVHFGSPEMEALSREQILQPVSSPVHDDLLPGSVPAHREWAATLLSVWVQAYNTTLVDKNSLPKTYSDLLDPKWRGKLGIEAKDQDWFAAVVDVMGGRETGLDVLSTAGSGWHIGSPWTHPSHQHGDLRRGSPGAHGLQLHARAGQEEGRADRLVCIGTGDCALECRGRRASRAAPQCGAPLL